MALTLQPAGLGLGNPQAGVLPLHSGSLSLLRQADDAHAPAARSPASELAGAVASASLVAARRPCLRSPSPPLALTASAEAPKALSPSSLAPAAYTARPAPPRRRRKVRPAQSTILDVAAVFVPSARVVPRCDRRPRLRAYVVYDILVKAAGRSDDWTIHRRYSNFLELHKQLPKTEGVLPKLPPKRWFNNLNPAFIERRRQALESYLQGLCAVPALRLCPRFRDFIGLSSEDPSNRLVTFPFVAHDRGSPSWGSKPPQNRPAAMSPTRRRERALMSPEQRCAQLALRATVRSSPLCAVM